jgi:hypothetical protein
MNYIPNKGVGYVLAAAFFLDAWFVGLALQRMGDYSVRVGIKASACACERVAARGWAVCMCILAASEVGRCCGASQG